MYQQVSTLELLAYYVHTNFMGESKAKRVRDVRATIGKCIDFVFYYSTC